MRKLLLGLALLFGLLAPASAVVQSTNVGDAAYTILATDTNIATTTTFTAARTWTLPFAASTCIGQTCTPAASQLQIIDTAGAISSLYPLTIAPQSGETINGNSANLTLSAAGARVVLVPTSSGNWQAFTTGDFVTSGVCPGTGGTATVTMTIAAPGVVTWTAHGITGACPVVFTTSGGLPTGITSGTTYWVVPSSVATNTFQVATTVANALAGTSITTSGSQSGTHTGTGGSTLTSTTAANVTGLSLTQGDWDCRATVAHNLGASTSVTVMSGSINQTTATVGTRGSNGTVLVSTAANVLGTGGQDIPIGPVRQSLTGTTNVFLVAQDTFSVSTNVSYGALSCRRVR